MRSQLYLSLRTKAQDRDADAASVVTQRSTQETGLSHDRLIFIDKEKAWHEAQDYCREHHTDLASGVGQLNSLELQNSLNDSDKSQISFFRDTWRFSHGSSSSYRNWERQSDEKLDEKCAVMNTSGKRYYDLCDAANTSATAVNVW